MTITDDQLAEWADRATIAWAPSIETAVHALVAEVRRLRELIDKKLLLGQELETPIIDKLEARIAELEGQIALNVDYAKQVAKVEAENHRLREAITKSLGVDDDGPSDQTVVKVHTCKECGDLRIGGPDG